MIVVADTTPLISLMKADRHIGNDMIQYAFTKLNDWFRRRQPLAFFCGKEFSLIQKEKGNLITNPKPSP